MNDDPPPGPYAQLLDAYWLNSPCLHPEHGTRPAPEGHVSRSATRVHTAMMILSWTTIAAAFTKTAAG
jgi:hypothetical protein